MGMDSPSGPPPDMAKLTGDWSLVAKGLGAYSERVEDPAEVGPALQRAISRGEEKALEDHFTRTRDIRRGIIDAKQD